MSKVPPKEGGINKYDPHIIKRLRAAILQQLGVNGIRTVCTSIRENTKNVTHEGLRDIFRQHKIYLSNEDFEAISKDLLPTVSHCDDTNTNNIIASYTNFFQALCNTITARRMTVLDITFRSFESYREEFVTEEADHTKSASSTTINSSSSSRKNTSSTVHLEELQRVYDGSRHPHLTEEEAVEQFFTYFPLSSNDGTTTTITRQEFIEYYAGLSAEIDSDDVFETIVLREWNLDRLAYRKQYIQQKVKQQNNDKKCTVRSAMHPLYQTTYQTYGAKAAEVNLSALSKSANRSGVFTKDYFGPPRYTGLNTSMSKK